MKPTKIISLHLLSFQNDQAQNFHQSPWDETSFTTKSYFTSFKFFSIFKHDFKNNYSVQKAFLVLIKCVKSTYEHAIFHISAEFIIVK